MSKDSKARQQADEFFKLVMFYQRNRNSPELEAKADAFKKKWGTFGPRQPLTDVQRKKEEERRDSAIAAELAKGKSVTIVRSIGHSSIAVVEMKPPSNRAVDPKKPKEESGSAEVTDKKDEA